MALLIGGDGGVGWGNQGSLPAGEADGEDGDLEEVEQDENQVERVLLPPAKDDDHQADKCQGHEYNHRRDGPSGRMATLIWRDP